MATFEATDATIDYARLKRHDQILFFDDVVLYEDELADNGLAQMTVKLRVMPTCFFVLVRYFMRLQDVEFRLKETRFYHAFGAAHLLRESTERRAPFAALKQVSVLRRASCSNRKAS
jgi:type 2A phosphatase activator TIP41